MNFSRNAKENKERSRSAREVGAKMDKVRPFCSCSAHPRCRVLRIPFFPAATSFSCEEESSACIPKTVIKDKDG